MKKHKVPLVQLPLPQGEGIVPPKTYEWLGLFRVSGKKKKSYSRTIMLMSAKYYIRTGSYRAVLIAVSPLQAAEQATKRFVDKSDKFRPGRFTNVSEVGFYDDDDDDASPDHSHDKLYESCHLASDVKNATIDKMKRKKRNC